MNGVFFAISVVAFLAALVLCIVGGTRLAGRPKPDTRPWNHKIRTYALAAGGIWAVTLILSFAIPTGASEPPATDKDPAQSEPDKYEQTWQPSYSDTSCTDWATKMSDEQQFAAAAEILVSAWAKIEGSSRFPSDSLIGLFQDAIDDSCVIDSMAITDASFAAYNDSDVFRP